MILGDVSTNDALIICAALGALPGTIAACIGLRNGRTLRSTQQQLKIPSGGTIGEKVEMTHDLAAVTVGHTTALVNGDAQPNGEG